jgi:hypothetical protein
MLMLLALLIFTYYRFKLSSYLFCYVSALSSALRRLAIAFSFSENVLFSLVSCLLTRACVVLGYDEPFGSETIVFSVISGARELLLDCRLGELYLKLGYLCISLLM